MPSTDSRLHVDPEAAARLIAPLREWQERGGSLHALAAASGVARGTIQGWLARGAPKGAVDFDAVMRVIRASRPR